MKLLNKISICLLLLFVFSSVVHLTGQTPRIKSMEQKVKVASGTKKVDLMMDLFDLYFTKGSKDQKTKYKDRIIKLGEDMLAEASKTKYRKAEILCYKKLADMYKHYTVPNLFIKYNVKYKQGKKELAMLEKAEVDEIKRQQSIKESEIKKLEQDKTLNKELIELKKTELEATKSALDKT